MAKNTSKQSQDKKLDEPEFLILRSVDQLESHKELPENSLIRISGDTYRLTSGEFIKIS